jgi:predicted ribosome quality control (RQC) complex YloA/Tae2 family protein
MPATPTPKDRFTSLDTLALVRELRAIDRAWVDKAFDLPTGGWSLALRVPGVGRRELALVPGRFAALLREPPVHREELSPFAKELRRLLAGAGLLSVAEPSGERFLELRFRRSDDPEELLLAVELFGTGNLLIAHGGRIAAVASPRQWAHRTVRVGSEYARPPVRVDPWTLGRAAIEATLARSRTDLASTLAARLSLGGPVAEELIARGGWDGSEAAAPRAREVGPKLHEEMTRILAEVGDRPTGHLYSRAGVAVDVTPYASRRWDGVPGIEVAIRPTFSEAATEYFATLVEPPRTEAEAEAARARRERERLLVQQRKAVEELSATVAELRAKAQAVLVHYAEAEAEVARLRAAQPSQRTAEIRLGETVVSLDLDRPLRDSARAFFEESKRIRGKLEGAESALKETESKLALPVAPPSERRSPAVGGARRKTHWFERYRWFLSSEGAIVVGGRDASSNDLLVRRHLKAGDLYLHADVQGAASVVVKHPNPGAPALTEVTLREAAQWAVAFSKAWRAGLASASAFWVAHDQVSKSGGSGEFVAKGAWVVHGTKNVLKDLPLELALGTIRYEGEERWTVAPPSAVRARGEVRVLLAPGEDRERGEREAELSKDLGVPRPLLQSLLPAGGLSIRRP